MSVDVGKNDGYTCVEVNKPYPNLPEEWVGIIDKELHQYLKLPSFNGSLADYFNWLVKFFELTRGLPYPASAFISGLAKYWNEVPRLFLELQETPHQIVLRIDDVRLLHYILSKDRLSTASYPKKKLNTPLLVIYAPVNHYHIMDIRKGRSIIKQFAKEGFDVFLLD